MTNPSTPATETATLGGGCFWCLDAVFRRLRGVQQVVSGFSGGQVADPSYREVSEGRTGHAEVVQITFDPQAISFREILEVFFATHDPTTLNRQGADAGTQYRSAVHFHSPEQQRTADTLIAELQREGMFDDPIVTEVEPAGAFYPAEAYHQDYYANNPRQMYCVAVIGPKVATLRSRFAERLAAV